MNPADWLLLLLLLIAVAAAITALILGRRKHRGCGGCCTSCPHCAASSGTKTRSPLGQSVTVHIGRPRSDLSPFPGPYHPVHCSTASECGDRLAPDIYLLGSTANEETFTGTVIARLCSQDQRPEIWIAAPAPAAVSREAVEQELRSRGLPFPDKWEHLSDPSDSKA